MSDTLHLDPMRGWRAGAIHYCNKRDVDHGFHERGVKAFERGAADESSIKHAREAGSFRATLLKDHVSKSFFKSEHYLQHYVARNITDTMYIVAPINSDTEVYFCFNRVNRADSFKQSDLERASHALRGLKWFNQKMLLGQGLMLAEAPLTPTERKVLSNLLTDKSEKQIAVILNKRTDTVHKHVSSIYRKFNVQSRAALMAIWLGQLPERSPAND